MACPLDRFRHIVLADTEFIARPGELYEPVCLAWKELRSGQSGALFCDELGGAPPHPHDRDTLFVGFTAAEPEFYLSIGWPFNMAFLDLRVEHINLTNISEKRLTKPGQPARARPPRSLIDILRSHGIRDGDAAHKAAIRQRILQGPPFTAEERRQFLAYCITDVALLEKLLGLVLPCIRHLGQALMRGEYVKLTAEIFRAGQPADPWAAGWLGRPAIRHALRLRAVSDTSLTHGLYDGTKLTQTRLHEFITRYGIKGWRVTRSGRLGTANRDFIRLAEDRRFRDVDGRSRFADLPDVDKILDQLHELQLIAGSDNRYRTPIWAFSTITGRMAPNGAAYPFATASWTRPTMMPAPGMALAYLDFASMEFGVVAGLSQCQNMLVDYDAEPYLVLPILAKLLPADATKVTHRAEREAYKAPTLSLQYGGGASLMVHKLGVTKSQGQRLVDLHHDRYADYWAWSDRKVQRAFEDGELITLDGWRCGVTSFTTEFTARNWLIQANAQAIFRYAGLMMRAVGLRLVAIVHDAVLIEAPADQIDREVARATVCLERASRRFLRGLTLRVDPKIIRDGERFTDGRGAKVWAFVERTLREIEEGRIDVA